MEERIMYVIQRAGGQFYWEDQSISSYYRYDSFDKAHLFSTEKGAKSRASHFNDGQEYVVKQVKVTLLD